jgi:hypothetical protein
MIIAWRILIFAKTSIPRNYLAKSVKMAWKRRRAVSLEITAFTLHKLSAQEGPTSKIPMTRTKATGILAIDCSMRIAWRMMMVAKTSMAQKGPAKSVKMATIGRRTNSVEITAWWDGTWSGTLLPLSLEVSCLFPFFAVSARFAVVQTQEKGNQGSYQQGY